MRLWNVLLGLTPFGHVGHVAFDLDGTLVDSRADLAAAVNRLRLDRGLAPLDVATVTGYVGEGIASLVRRALAPAADDGSTEAVAEFRAYYGDHCLDETRLYPGMRAALDVLRAGDRSLSVVTNKPRTLAERILRGLGVEQAFVAIVGGDSPETQKPRPEGLREVAACARVPIARTLLVGDSPIDLDTAAAAGSSFCGAAWGFAPGALRERNPRYIARDPRHLLELFATSGA